MARISKYPPIAGFGFDRHGKMAPTLFPPPPPAVGALVPRATWLHLIVNPLMAKITGKWSLESNTTEGMGDILWQYDWGPLQPHIPLSPPLLTPSILLILLSSSAKYWLPSFSVQERVDGGAMAKAAGGGSPVAISTPAFCISVENCWDTACAVSFNFPSGVCFQHVSTRWVAFNGGDLAAGLIGLAGDALSGAVLSYFGGKLMTGVVDNMLFGALANSALGFLVSLIPGWATVGGSSAAALYGFVRFMMTPVGKPGGYGFFAGALSAPINMASNWAASAVGDAWGSKPSDLPGAQPPPATTPSSPPAAASSSPPTTPPSPPPTATPAPPPGSGQQPPSGPPASTPPTSSPPRADQRGGACTPADQSGGVSTP